MPTRLYFNYTISGAPVNPAPSGAWSSTAGAGRCVLSPYRDGVTPAVSTLHTRAITIGATAPSTSLDRSCITPGLFGSQTISGRVSGQLMVREFANTDNVDQTWINAKVVSNDGNTIRGVLLAHARYGPNGQTVGDFINNATHRNKTLISGTTEVNVTTINALDGDRIVFEVGYGISINGTSPQASALWGGGAYGSPALPVNETQTTAAAGWIDFRDVSLKFRENKFTVFEDEELLN